MDYYGIGQRIRKYRKAHGWSQEQLAEQIGISITHMSHIETGNTKLSLPVLVDIAAVLNVRADDLLHDAPVGKSVAAEELQELLSVCTEKQLRVIIDVVKAAKTSMDKHM